MRIFKVNSRKKDKKGMMLPLSFLVTLILAIILWAFSCSVGAKIFRLSSQASQDFSKLLEMVNATHKGDYGIVFDTTTYNMDDKTAILTFPINSINYGDMILKKSGAMSVYIQRPTQCDDTKKSCICLCRNTAISEETEKAIGKKFECLNSYCEQYDFDILGTTKFGSEITQTAITTINMPPEQKPSWWSSELDYPVFFTARNIGFYENFDFSKSRTRLLNVERITLQGRTVIAICESTPLEAQKYRCVSDSTMENYKKANNIIDIKVTVK